MMTFLSHHQVSDSSDEGVNDTDVKVKAKGLDSRGQWSVH